MDLLLFPFSDYWWFYLSFTLFVFFMLALDLGVFHKETHRVTFKEATTWSLIWIGLALVFNYGFYQYAFWKFAQDPRFVDGGAATVASQIGLEFLTGYLVEKSLSIDNLFVFVAVFAFFGIPEQYQHRVLFYGILGALLFRALFIALGSILMQYEWIVLFFGGLLIVTGIKMFFAPKNAIDPSKNFIIKLLKKFLPVTSSVQGKCFFVVENGVRYATPLFLSLVFIELSDIIFAVDSVPAIFALTDEPLIVYTSNVFAILGLRSLYFMLAGVYHKFHLLKYGLGLVLIFVGLKMVWLNELYGGKFPVSWSLALIGVVIAAAVVVSLMFPTRSGDGTKKLEGRSS